VAITDEVNQMVGFLKLFGACSRAKKSLMPMNRCIALVCDWSVITYLETMWLPQTPDSDCIHFAKNII